MARNPEMKEPRSGKISSLSQCFLKHSPRAEARVEKSEGSSEGKSLSPLGRFRRCPISDHRN